jgi:hypothetical protein
MDIVLLSSRKSNSMKFLSTIALLLLFTWTSTAQEIQEEVHKEIPKELKSLLEFEHSSIELGKVKKGDTRQGTFKFTNVSKEEVQIEFISVCECTQVDYPTLPIKPGESGKIDFTFDSSEKDKSEEIVLDVLLTNVEPISGYQIVESVHYTYELVE